MKDRDDQTCTGSSDKDRLQSPVCWKIRKLLVLPNCIHFMKVFAVVVVDLWPYTPSFSCYLPQKHILHNSASTDTNTCKIRVYRSFFGQWTYSVSTAALWKHGMAAGSPTADGIMSKSVSADGALGCGFIRQRYTPRQFSAYTNKSALQWSCISVVYIVCSMQPGGYNAVQLPGSHLSTSIKYRLLCFTEGRKDQDNLKSNSILYFTFDTFLQWEC